MSVIFDREPKTPTKGRWYYLRDDGVPTGQIDIMWVSSHEYGRIIMSGATALHVGTEDFRSVAAAQHQAVTGRNHVRVMAYDRTGIVDPIRQTIKMMQDTLTSIGKNNGQIDPLSFSACQQSMGRLRALMAEAQQTYDLLAEAYVEAEA